MLQFGPYSGALAKGWQERSALLVDALASWPAPSGRSEVTRCEIDGAVLAVKSFSRCGFWASRKARRYGSKAERSWRMARALEQNEIGTPRPVAFLDRWEGGRLTASYFVTAWEDDVDTLSTHLLSIYHREPRYRRLLNLLDAVAEQVQRMHDAGIVHGDMGNQNILVRRTGVESFEDVRFIDLNRGRTHARAATWRERTFDVSRLTLPSRMRQMVGSMMFPDTFHAGQRLPRAYQRWLGWHRFKFGVHSWTRRVRRPLREWRKAKAKRGEESYPRSRDIWIWDEHTEQAIGVWTSREKNRMHSWTSALRIAWCTVASIGSVRRRKSRVQDGLYGRSVPMRNRIGLTITVERDTIERKRALIESIGKIPLLVRFHHHETPEQIGLAMDAARSFHARGHDVSLALVQDRRAVTDPALWSAFVERVVGALGDIATYVEVGHAINRVKWGLWSLGEIHALYRPVVAMAKRFPNVGFIGPAVNDFEFHFLFASLPRRPHLRALSLHLYMDRAGAPEGVQKILGALVSGIDKFAYARAVAELSDRVDDAVIVSEVNWPLGAEGGQSHEFAPYVWVGDPNLDTTNSLRVTAEYMVRYYLHALCSGAIERVYWWKLVNHSFGLVANSDSQAWKERPGMVALRVLFRRLGSATFHERLPSAPDLYLLRFTAPNEAGENEGDETLVAFAPRAAIALPFAVKTAHDVLGVKIEPPTEAGPSPVYLTR